MLQHIASGEEIRELYTWGRATNYQLGFGATGSEQPLPRPAGVPARFQLSSVACGHFHSVAVASCGAVLCWGFGGATSRLGIDAPDGGAPPQCVVEPTPLAEFGAGAHAAAKAAAGLNHTLVLTRAGKVLAWGSNQHGQVAVQGVGTGEGAQCLRPQTVKGALKSEEVTAVAAGVAHSVCVTKTGMVFAWGSNTFGALGLGAPPTGPKEAASPQPLPHLRGAREVACCPSLHVSAVVLSHGDPVIFGMAQGPDERAGGAGGAGAAARVAAADPKFFLPSRVRRSERKANADEDWQKQRGCGQGLAPVLSLAFGTREGFGIDARGSLWSWSLLDARPATAVCEAIYPAVSERSPAQPAMGGQL